MATFTLEDIQSAADEKYGPTVVEYKGGSATFRTPIRMSKDERAQLVELHEAMNEEGADQEKLVEDMLRLTATKESEAEELIRQVGGDLAVLISILESYLGESQVGEASASQD